MSTPQVLGMFAKVPRPGRVKTRLAATLGPEVAADIYAAFLRHLLARLALPRYYKSLAYWPAGEAGYFSDFLERGWQLEPQCPGELGLRMQEFFRTKFARSQGQVVLIGSDNPDLPLRLIHSAFEKLENSDVVVGPSHDGGYYLIGMARFHPEIFQGIPWSTPRVFAETIARLKQLGTPHAILDPWYDVDDAADLEGLLARLGQWADHSEESRRLKERLTQLLSAGPEAEPLC